MSKIFFRTTAMIILSAIIAPIFVLADGMVIWPDPTYPDQWRYRDEESQLAFINYQDGLQKMIISTGLKQENGNGVWLFPVPAKPEKVVIDVVDQFPNWRGMYVYDAAKNNLSEIGRWLNATQIYPEFFRPRYIGTPMYSVGNGLNALQPTDIVAEKTDVTVYEHLDKEGITTEIITAKTGSGLYDYLKSKNLNVLDGSIPVLNNYIGKDFTFVVSWLAETQVPIDQSMPVYNSYPYYKSYYPQKGVFVAFQTNKMYYPLMPTSVYQSKVIPTTIKVYGFVSPRIFKDIKPYTEVKYLVEDSYYSSSGPQIFYNNSNRQDLKYTLININAPSKMLSDDLWIKNSAPMSASYALTIARHPAVWFIFALVIISALTGFIVGLIFFKEARFKKGWWKFAVLGLFNCLSIIGLIIATLFTPTKNIKEEDKELFATLKKKGYNSWLFRVGDFRKIGFIAAYSLIFMLLSFVIVGILGLGI